MRNILTALMMVLLSVYAVGQTSYKDLKEKVYVQTSHSFFKPGETVWFKVYVVKGKDNKPSNLANRAIVEIISPAGSVAQTMSLQLKQGYATGSFPFAADAKGGVYKLRAYTDLLKNEDPSAWFLKELTVQKVISPRVLMRLDFKERAYGAGSVMKADISLRNLNDKPIADYPLTYKISVGGEELANLKARTDNKGKATLEYTLPAELKTADGLLNVMVDYRGYNESISRAIPLVTDRLDLQFMPEGGNLVAGVLNNIAFKALKDNGKAADFKGVVMDAWGSVVDTIRSFHFGMGSFQMIPQSDMNYQVRILEPAGVKQVYRLPTVARRGLAMMFTQDQDAINIDLRGAIAGVQMVVSCHEVPVMNTVLPVVDSTVLHLTYRAGNFPAGINRFSFYDMRGKPLAERIVFIGRERKLNIEIKPSKELAGRRERMQLDIITTDDKGKPVPANISVGVSDDKLWSFADDRSDHISSWLLMSSELKGEIEEPRYYFDSTGAKVDHALDLVMLTHGYRYFQPNEVVRKTNRLQFYPERGYLIGGRVADHKGRPLSTEVICVSPTMYFKRTQSDSLGYFMFHADEAGYYQFLARAESGAVRIYTLPQDSLEARIPQPAQAWRDISFEAVGELPPSGDAAPALLAKQDRAFGEDKPMPNSATALNEVVVTGYGVTRRDMMLGAVSTITAKDIELSPMLAGQALQGRVAGLEVLAANGNPGAAYRIMIRGTNSIRAGGGPLYVVDGVVRSGAEMQAYNVEDIQSITVLKDQAATALWGSGAANGVIVIETIKSTGGRIIFGKVRPTYTSAYASFYPDRENYARYFYAPRYESTKTSLRNDFRETIFWNGVVQTDSAGKAHLEYYNSDAQTTFRIVAEGISVAGQIGRAEKTYAVQSQLQVDVKIPPYLTVGDKAQLPMVIRNNTNKTQVVDLNVSVPGAFQLGAYPVRATLAANSSRKILIPLTASQAGEGNIVLHAETSDEEENIAQPISATNKGFLVVRSVSGDTSAAHNILIQNPVNGTINSRIDILSDLKGQLTDGIESMLREPYGCFEQTSSSTYPNIYVLRYLRSRGQVDPAVEHKAMAYLKAGYERLKGFETPANGFEWFGNTPPHEALTAYGLMEFTDMKGLIDVNEKMIERTHKFLLSRRDGNGGFKMSREGYDAFRSVPNSVANNYIVWAMSEAGFGADVVPEYEACLSKLQNASDAYLLSMTALTAFNMKRMADYHFLMNRLAGMAIDAETSVVNSRGQSLLVETKSLYALALMKDPASDKGRLANCISDILSQHSYYGYGSTQATVLALKVLVAFADYSSIINKDVVFTLNNQTVHGGSMNELLHSGPNDFRVSYEAAKNNAPYYGEVSYYTLTPQTDPAAEIGLKTKLATNKTVVGETVRMNITVSNRKDMTQAMVLVKLGIPAGLSAQPWQLKELMDDKKIAYYEIFDNYLVFYFMGMARNEVKHIALDLKAEVPGTYLAKAGNAYLYYMPEHKDWVRGEEIVIEDKE